MRRFFIAIAKEDSPGEFKYVLKTPDARVFLVASHIDATPFREQSAAHNVAHAIAQNHDVQAVVHEVVC